MPEKKEWTNQQLSDYITHFSDVQRETILNEILRSKVIGSYLSKAEGRIVLENAVDTIRNEIVKILQSCLVEDVDDYKAIKKSGMKINIAYDFIRNIADLVLKAEKHQEQIIKGLNG